MCFFKHYTLKISSFKFSNFYFVFWPQETNEAKRLLSKNVKICQRMLFWPSNCTIMTNSCCFTFSGPGSDPLLATEESDRQPRSRAGDKPVASGPANPARPVDPPPNEWTSCCSTLMSFYVESLNPEYLQLNRQRRLLILKSKKIFLPHLLSFCCSTRIHPKKEKKK